MNGHKIDRRVFASSINLEVELEPFAFVNALQARTFNRTDVHESIGLTIVARQEAEALHRVEELDRSGRFFAGQFTLRRTATRLHFDYVTDNLEILSRHLAATVDEVELKLLPFGETFEAGTLHGTDVNKDIFATSFLLDKAEAFLAVEKLDRSFAGTNDLSGHAVETAATTAAAARAAGATTAGAAAAEPVTTATEAITAAGATVIIETTASATAEIVARGHAVHPAAKWIETLFAKSVALVPAAAAPSVVTHNLIRTLSCRPKIDLSDEGDDHPTEHSGRAG